MSKTDRTEYFKEYYARNKDKKKAASKKRLQDLPEENKKACRKYYRKINAGRHLRISYVDESERHIIESACCEQEIKKLIDRGWGLKTIASYKNILLSRVENIAYGEKYEIR